MNFVISYTDFYTDQPGLFTKNCDSYLNALDAFEQYCKLFNIQIVNGSITVLITENQVNNHGRI